MVLNEPCVVCVCFSVVSAGAGRQLLSLHSCFHLKHAQQCFFSANLFFLKNNNIPTDQCSSNLYMSTERNKIDHTVISWSPFTHTHRHPHKFAEWSNLHEKHKGAKSRGTSLQLKHGRMMHLPKGKAPLHSDQLL